jgi:hypothetical protein
LYTTSNKYFPLKKVYNLIPKLPLIFDIELVNAEGESVKSINTLGVLLYRRIALIAANILPIVGNNFSSKGKENSASTKVI